MASESRVQRVSAAAIGELLREAREKKSLTIGQVQAQTRIHSTVLQALEEGRADELLPAAYARSFLKKYTDYLGLDSKDILNKYSSLHPVSQSPNQKINIPEVKEPVDMSGLFHVAKRAIVFVIILVVVLFLGSKLVGSFKKHKAARRQDPAAKSRPTAQQPIAQKKTPAKPQVINQTGREDLPFNFTLKVKQNVYIKFKKDGEILFSRVIDKGSVESYSVQRKVELDVAKAEVVELVIDGKSLVSPGKGVIKNIEITKKGVKIR